jgi:hypothetical protein
MVRTITRWPGLVLLAGVLAAAAGTVPALAAPSPSSGGWRVVATFASAKEPLGLDSVVAFSARDAWAASSPGAPQPALVLSWAGHGWRKASLPASVRKGLNGGATVTGSSAADVWLYNQSDWARWNGKGWATGKIPLVRKGHRSQSGQLLTFSPANAWFIGQYFTPDESHPFAEHFNGRSWRAMPAPPVTSFVLSGASSSTICAMNGQFGSAVSATTILACWNGSRWHRLKLPRALDSRNAIIGSILVRSLHDIWVGGGRTGGASGIRGLAAHWTGTAWHLTVLPAVATLGTDVLDLLGQGRLRLRRTGLAPVALHRRPVGRTSPARHRRHSRARDRHRRGTRHQISLGGRRAIHQFDHRRRDLGERPHPERRDVASVDEDRAALRQGAGRLSPGDVCLGVLDHAHRAPPESATIMTFFPPDQNTHPLPVTVIRE